MLAMPQNQQRFQKVPKNTPSNQNQQTITKKEVKYVQYQPGDEKIKFDDQIVEYLKPIEVSNEEDLSKLLNEGITIPKVIYQESKFNSPPNIKSPEDNLKPRAYSKTAYPNIQGNNSEKPRDNQPYNQNSVNTSNTFFEDYKIIDNNNQQNPFMLQKNGPYYSLHTENSQFNTNPTYPQQNNNPQNAPQNMYKDDNSFKPYSSPFKNNPLFEKVYIPEERPTMTDNYRVDQKQQIYKNLNPYMSYKQDEVLSNINLKYHQQSDVSRYNRFIDKNNNDPTKKNLNNFANGQSLYNSTGYVDVNNYAQKTYKKSYSTIKNQAPSFSLSNANSSKVPASSPRNIKIVMSKNKTNISAAKIQRKWRGYYLINKFKLTQKENLASECEQFLNRQYALCDKDGQIVIKDFDPNAWQNYYKSDDPFFNPNSKIIKLKKAIKILYPDDPIKISIYEGEVNINNQKHGYGMLSTPNMVYIGNWENDKFTGWGRITKRNGFILEGKYYNGVLEGKGIIKNGEGCTYEGEFRNSKRHGKGVLETKKVHYEGEFLDDKLAGYGKIEYKSEGHSYEGQFWENEINGYGIFRWNNGDYYEGEIKNGKMNGKGKFVAKNGYVFIGRYANGIKQPGGIEFQLGEEN